MKLQIWNVTAVSDDSSKVIGTVTTSTTAKPDIARAKAWVKYAPEGFTLGFKLKVTKSGTKEV